MLASRIGLLVCLLAGVAPAGSLSAEATGSAAPALAYAGSITNGDFLIETLHSYPIGDGEDDWTSWTFDFTADPEYSATWGSGGLSSAVLTLTLTPVGPNVSSDLVTVGTLSPIGPAEIRTLVPGSGVHTVSLDLLDHFTSSQVLGAVHGSAGLVDMLYQDDTIVSFAKLEVVAVPVPAAVWMGLALLGLVIRRSTTRR